MNIIELNTKLQAISSSPSRDSVLDFAFALMQWMNIAPNPDLKPQLLAPQTQKLRDYLAPAPLTAQPQLYRLSAEAQNVRVRFAVLKKSKKDYINQLVDNDPGLSSFQSFSKNLNNTLSDGQVFIPSQPYFVHFITTPEYDKLTLIFNQGENKRIVSFRGRLTHTQYNKIIDLWKGIGTKSKPEIADLFWSSLDIKEVNKQFYQQIKERFDALVGIVKLQHHEATDNQVKQFTVRMIGRYIFCWFLKEKGIIDYSLISKAAIEKTPQYYQTILLNLFFETLNTKVQDRDPLTANKIFATIPYLNGGLFEQSDEDKLFSHLDLDEWLLPFVEILESYDFTVDESNSQYQQVAVDPEMLGRIFENLLASQNPETEKAASNERKATGAFYTPREIVDYMVDESLKTYLSKKLSVSDNELTSAFGSNPTWPQNLNKRKKDAEQALINIKILDPACGSGAFPMGVLHRLISLRELTGLQPDTYQLKKEILSNNIYGIDIMPMAVEIARLRAWLSLIVEEDYKGEKIASNFGIDALPNLDFKFMQGNSLLESYEGIKLFDEKLLDQTPIEKPKTLFDETKKKIEELESKYLEIHDNGDLNTVEGELIIKELKKNKDVLKKIRKVDEPQINFSLFGGEEHLTSISKRLQQLHKELFSTSEKDEKKKLKVEIEAMEWGLISSSLKQLGNKERLDDLENLRKQNIKPYFLYKLNFPEVFTENGGFDIVIGNPPYVRHESIDPYYKPKYEANHPDVGSGTADLYIYFFDSAISVTNKGGIIIFITLNKFLKTKYGEGLRKKLENKNVDLIIDFFELPVFEASTDTAITKIINDSNINSTRYFPVKSLDNLDLVSLTKGPSLLVNKDGSEWKFIELSSKAIIEKIYKDTVSLKDFTGDKIFFGIKTGLNKAFELTDEEANNLINSESRDIVKPFIKSTDIKKYKLKSYNKFFLITGFEYDIPNLFPSAFKHLKKYEDQLKKRQDQGRKWYNLRACSYYEEFEKPKLVYIYTAKRQEFYLDLEGRYINNNCYAIISDNKFLFFFLNSILFDWFKRIKFVAYGDADESGRVKLDYNKMITVPIKKISKLELKWFENRYDELMSEISDSFKIKAVENIVEAKLFKIYELTYDEVKVIDNNFWLSEKEYNDIKLNDENAK